ncbi:Predicted N-acyltransferase, GNAT family [Marininema mesophilum]|uniref:Predicted N-acyltransferase, GNAT family n=1 Tax=Marininema mesophilum TaxID=1048340 RepID=A0A1H2QM25_9BACL|nr:GNAT family N-acetyltransferase [Marininema mesophilum]SDW08202.1 Predicted N-acyltransferase, GNAT family [Marininema mesophilum]
MSIEISIITDKTAQNEALSIRKTVFVGEQGVPLALETDEHEEQSTHFIARMNGYPAGTLRFRWLSKELGKVERVAVLSQYRGARIGVALMQAVEDYAHQQGALQIKLSAQTNALPFYTKLGYQEVGSPYMDAGIEHITMGKSLTSEKV